MWQHVAKTHTVDDRTTGTLETHMVAQRLPLLTEAFAAGAVEGAKLRRSAMATWVCAADERNAAEPSGGDRRCRPMPP